MNINEYLQKHKKFIETGLYKFRQVTPRLECADGFNMSVHVGKNMYCQPRVEDAPVYSHCEVGFPSEKEEALMPYVDGNIDQDDGDGGWQTVYAEVPVEVIDEIITKHGGIKA